MKPRTKLHHQLVKYSSWLTQGVQDKIQSFAISTCNSKYGFSTGKTFWCGVCGDTHSSNEIVKNEVTCKSCNSELHIVETKKRKFFESYYIAYAEEMFEFQVIRLFHVSVNYRKGEHWETSSLECVQQFHNDLDYHIIGRLTHYGNDPLYGPMEIRQPSYYKHLAYNPYPSHYHPASKFLPEFEMKGCQGDLGNICFSDLKKQLNFNCSKTETLLKAGYTSLLKVAVQNTHKIQKYWDSIKICIRKNYKPLDGGIYIDYLDLLEQFNKDIRNPKFICPEDLHREHNFYVDKNRRIREREETERRRVAEIEQLRQNNYSQEEYYKDKSQYFGIHFKKGKLSIKVLETIEEFKEEAEVHKHCVFSNKYYAKKNSLILSARVNNAPIETIELSLTNFAIIQSRGLQNKSTQYHNDIIELINKNIHLIMDINQELQEIA